MNWRGVWSGSRTDTFRLDAGDQRQPVKQIGRKQTWSKKQNRTRTRTRTRIRIRTRTKSKQNQWSKSRRVTCLCVCVLARCKLSVAWPKGGLREGPGAGRQGSNNKWRKRLASANMGNDTRKSLVNNSLSDCAQVCVCECVCGMTDIIINTISTINIIITIIIIIIIVQLKCCPAFEICDNVSYANSVTSAAEDDA